MKKKAWNKGLRSIAEIQNDPKLIYDYEYLQSQIQKFEGMGFHKYTSEEYLQKYQQALNYLEENQKQPKQ